MISPRTSIIFGAVVGSNFMGMDLIVRTLWVTSSPVSPSPLVVAYLRVPDSYTKFIATPSSFGSATNSISSFVFNLSLMRFSNESNSSPEKTLSSESIGFK